LLPIRLFFFSKEKLVQRRAGPGYLLQHTEEEETEEGSDRGRRERLVRRRGVGGKSLSARERGRPHSQGQAYEEETPRRKCPGRGQTPDRWPGARGF